MNSMTTFRAWRDAWDDVRVGAVSEVLDLWNTCIPDPWMRSEEDIPKRLLLGPRYTRGDLNPCLRGESVLRGEHEIEYEILVTQFDTDTCIGRSLLDGVNAYPLVKDSAGGRKDDVEADLLLLIGPVDAAYILVSDVKKTDGNSWSALVQNLRQLRLFTANPVCASIFNNRASKANVVEYIGGVIAPKAFYSGPGQRANSLSFASKLSRSMLETHKVRTEMLVWHSNFGQICRYA
jgi:hypothetical protein